MDKRIDKVLASTKASSDSSAWLEFLKKFKKNQNHSRKSEIKSQANG